MPIRTTRSIVRFSSEFVLSGLDAAQPAGEYEVEQDEELLEASITAYRRVATYIHLPAIAVPSLTRQMVSIDPDELEAAIAKDRA
ncbi:hypothetical protein [Chelativorans sp.]|uniref:hypothetical protein n=1 Tax=Chelativorans sp. TaxID=2203393 RepID=UPI0028112EAB|nr:hypothetical protein [Chelativorans sp.]